MEGSLPKRDRYCSSAAGLLTVLTLFDVGTASAKIMILSSDIKTIKVNTDLQDGERLQVPAGKSIKIMLPAGTISVVNGPADVPVTELERGNTQHAAME